jgi:hypothetical protein
MAESLPKIKVTDPPNTGTSYEGQEGAVAAITEGKSHVSPSVGFSPHSQKRHTC